MDGAPNEHAADGPSEKSGHWNNHDQGKVLGGVANSQKRDQNEGTEQDATKCHAADSRDASKKPQRRPRLRAREYVDVAVRGHVQLTLGMIQILLVLKLRLEIFLSCNHAIGGCQ
jgi:hypothetical protein